MYSHKNFILWMKTKIKKEIKQINDHEYYGPLIETYIKTILNSGLLLDEDFEAILNSVSPFKSFTEQKRYKPSSMLLASIFSALGFSALANKYSLPLLAVPSGIVALTFVFFEIVQLKNKQKRALVVRQLTEIISKTHRLNRNMVKYMRTRSELDKNAKSFGTLFNKSTEDFLIAISENEQIVIAFLIDALKNVSLYCTDLQSDCEELEAMQLVKFVNDEYQKNYEYCEAFFKKIYDMNVFLHSKLLCYIGVVLLSKSSDFNENHLSTLLNTVIPHINAYLNDHYKHISKQFDILKGLSFKKIKYETTRTSGSYISRKLHDTLACSVTNLSVIMEKSQLMLKTIDNDETDMDKVYNCITDLRNHTYAMYESLDVLCRLSGKQKNSGENKKLETLRFTKSELNIDPNLKTHLITCDENFEPIEERFELYVKNNDESEESNAKCDIDESGSYLRLMLHELKQSLKQHERFVEAKNRRESKDDEEEENVHKQNTGLLEKVPKFNLDIPQQSICSTNDEHTNIPAAPALSLCNLTADLENESDFLNRKLMLNNIKLLSSQRKIEEETFGEAEDSDCSSGYEIVK